MMTTHCGCDKNLSCGCCEGVEALTPQPTANRPGLNELRYRVGTHAAFFETMRARLANFYVEKRDETNGSAEKIYPLKNLRTRLSSDSSISLLSAAATMLDVLTFYQERVANEGFLRTATERRSVLELGRLVGYTPRPGVSASVYLAYTLDDNSKPVEIPAGARAQSVPLPNELPQTFETAEKLAARKEWNDLKPRAARPQNIRSENIESLTTIYFAGTETNLKPNDPLLFVFGAKRILRKVKSVEPLFDLKKTKVALQFAGDGKENLDGSPNIVNEKPIEPALNSLLNLTKPLSLLPSQQPANSLLLKRDANRIFAADQDTAPQIIGAFNKKIGADAYRAWANATVTKPSPVKVYALRVSAPLFGNAAPRKILEINRQTGEIRRTGEYPIVEVFNPKPPPPGIVLVPDGEGDDGNIANLPTEIIKHESEKSVYLDASYDKIVAGSWAVIDTSGVRATFDDAQIKEEERNFTLPKNDLLITRIEAAATSISRAEYGISGKTTRLELDDDWIVFKKELRTSADFEFALVRRAVVHTQSEHLELADEPISDDVRGDRIELGALYEKLTTGRWAIVSGERTDIPNTSGIRASELVMLAGIEQSYDPNLPGDKIHTTLLLANRLAYTYKRDTVKIYGNVVKATHGETGREVLGSGNAAQAMQAFALKQTPLTFVSAPTTSGIESTLRVRVNDVEWHETDSLAELKPTDRKFITKTDDEAKTTVVFGNGEQGARLPTGIENVAAVYRSGIGKGGNVKAEQISLVLTKPLGVKEVVNPLRATGGADKETRDQARRNVPIALSALDRLVSVKDYADFAKTFAGIGKASAASLPDNRRRIVHLTIAGADDAPVDANSDLYRNLRRALLKYGDMRQPLKIERRELLALVIAASVAVHPDYLWEAVAPKIRAALLDKFSFERRELGQSVFLSEVVSAIQAVEGVIYADVDVLDGIAESDLAGAESLQAKLLKLQETKTPNQYVAAQSARRNESSEARKNPTILPAQLAYLLPDVPDTLILNRIEEVKK